MEISRLDHGEGVALTQVNGRSVFWTTRESVRAIIDEHVAPHDVVVAQIPLGDLATVSELAGAFPEVVFLSEPMAAAEF